MRTSNISIIEIKLSRNDREMMDELNRISTTEENCNIANAVDHLGYSIAHYAASRGHRHVLEFLVRNGYVNLEARTSMGSTLLDLATQSHDIATITYVNSLNVPGNNMQSQTQNQNNNRPHCARAA